MVKLKIDGQIVEYRSWSEVHSDVGEYSNGRCVWFESHCICNGNGPTEFCDCHENCARESLDAKHEWEEIKE